MATRSRENGLCSNGFGSHSSRMWDQLCQEVGLNGGRGWGAVPICPIQHDPELALRTLRCPEEAWLVPCLRAPTDKHEIEHGRCTGRWGKGLWAVHLPQQVKPDFLSVWNGLLPRSPDSVSASLFPKAQVQSPSFIMSYLAPPAPSHGLPQSWWVPLSQHRLIGSENLARFRLLAQGRCLTDVQEKLPEDEDGFLER